MDQEIGEGITSAIDELEDLLGTLDPAHALDVRKTVLMILLRNGLIAASQLHRDHETRAFVDASRILEARNPRH
jgi:hypothetical protein